MIRRAGMIGSILLFSMLVVGPALFVSGANAQTPAQGDLLATTNRGELVLIDLSAGTAVLLGRATVPPGRSVSSWGWSDLAFEPEGDLFAVSRRAGELGGVSRLYRIDPASGEILEDIGSTGLAFLTDIDFAADGTLFGNRFVSLGGGLIFINPSNATVQIPGSLLFSQSLQNGGFAVHPVTGELWGIETRFSPMRRIFKIDPNTGLASDVVRLGLNQVPLPSNFGFDALEILPDGRFIAIRAGMAFGNEIYEVNPVPDPVSGLAEVTLIPLVLPALDGTLNGLTVAGHRFAEFNVNKAEIKFKTASAVNDRFSVKGTVTLDENSDGIDPAGQGVVVRVGTSAIIIPAGSFTEKGSGKFKFKGPINGADVKMEIKQIYTDTYRFKVEAKGVDLTGTPNPLGIFLAIGNDRGTTMIRLKGKLKFKAEREVEDDDKDKDKEKDDEDDDDEDDDDDDDDNDD